MIVMRTVAILAVQIALCLCVPLVVLVLPERVFPQLYTLFGVHTGSSVDFLVKSAFGVLVGLWAMGPGAKWIASFGRFLAQGRRSYQLEQTRPSHNLRLRGEKRATPMEPPRSAEALLYFFLPQRDRDTVPGDLVEEYVTIIFPKFGLRFARAWYWKQVLCSVLVLASRQLAKLAGLSWFIDLIRRRISG